jgi:hypothetical protein
MGETEMVDNQNEGAGLEAGSEVETSETVIATQAVEKEAEATQVEKADEPEATEGNAGDDAGKPKNLPGSVRLKAQNRELQARIAQLERAAATPAQTETPPKLEDYPDWDSHQLALMKFAAKQELDLAKEAASADLVEAHKERLQEARQKIPDYDKVLKSYSGPDAEGHIAEILIASEKSDLLAYHLASRPALVRDLNDLTPVEAARRIGQIEARLSYPQPKTQSNAPPPLNGIKGASNPQRSANSQMSDDAYARWRNGE